MHGDTSSSSGYRVEVTAARPAAAADSDTSGRAAAAPSWTRVIATTLRLWTRRHLLRRPGDSRVSIRRRPVIAAVVVIVIAVAAGAVALAFARHPSPSAASRQHQATVNPGLAAAAAAALHSRQAAAGWIVGQVSTRTAIGCDPVMCTQLRSAGYPAAEQVALTAGGRLPAGAALVVATAAVRALQGAGLQTGAPTVIASFGTGPAQVQVRVIATRGNAGYQRMLHRALTARRHAGHRLLRSKRLHVRGASRHNLAAGHVDPRVLIILQRLLVARHTIYVEAFGNAGPGAAPSVPLRSVELAGLVARHGHHKDAELRSVLRLLRHQPQPYAARLTQLLLAGRVVLRIEFAAPSPDLLAAARH